MKNIQILTPRDPKTNMNSTSSSLAEDTDLCFFIFNKFQKQFKNAYKLIPSTLRLAPSSISSGAASHKVYNRQNRKQNNIEYCNNSPLNFHVLCHASLARITIIAFDGSRIFVPLAIMVGANWLKGQVVVGCIYSRISTFRRWSATASLNWGQFS